MSNLRGRPVQRTVPRLAQPANRPVPGGGALRPGPSQPPPTRGEFGAPTPGTYPGWKFPQDNPPPTLLGPISATLQPWQGKIVPPCDYCTCYATPDAGGASVNISRGTPVTVIGSKVEHGITFLHVSWFGQNYWIDSNCIGT